VTRHRNKAIALALVLMVAACGDRGPGGSRDRGPRVLELNADTVRLPDSVRVATVRIDRTKRDEFEPGNTTVRVSDVVRFISSDAGSHAVAFDGDAMSPDARAFLERTGQLRSPPLLTAESRWVMSFEGAPPGDYPFRCPTHGVRGTITVTAR
jgi:plastocyanin